MNKVIRANLLMPEDLYQYSDGYLKLIYQRALRDNDDRLADMVIAERLRRGERPGLIHEENAAPWAKMFVVSLILWVIAGYFLLKGLGWI